MQNTLRKALKNCSQELNEIEKIIRKNGLDSQVKYLTMYALIKACGTIEFVFKSIIADFFKKSSIIQIHIYLEKTVREAATSPKYNNVANLLKKFDDKWSSDFKDAMKNHPHYNRIISSMNSLVENRHQFAHGKLPTVTFRDIKNYFNDSKEFLEILDKVVK